MVSFLLHVDAIHLHHTVPGAQPRHFCRGTGLHFADELTGLSFLAMQVESIPAVPFRYETEPWFPLAGHFLPPFKTLVLEKLAIFFFFMGVKAAVGRLCVTFYPPNESAMQTITTSDAKKQTA